jgi:GTP-binding protein
LGDRFLGHVERCSVLLHLVDGTGEHAGKDYRVVRHEIEAYGEGLAEKPEIVALSKIDSLDPETRKKQLDRLKRACGQKPLALSAVSGEGVQQALSALLAIIEVQRKAGTGKEPAKPWQP